MSERYNRQSFLGREAKRFSRTAAPALSVSVVAVLMLSSNLLISESEIS